MKLIVKFVSISYILIIIFTSMYIYINAESNIDTKDTVIDNYELDYVIEFNDIFIKEIDNKIFINTLIDSYEYLGKIIDYSISENCYIIMYDNEDYCVLVVTKEEVVKHELQEFNKINSIEYYNDSIYLVGEVNYNLLVVKYDLMFKIISKTNFDGDGYQEGTKILVSKDYIYIGGIKSAHTLNEYFLNVGNKGDTKSFIFKFDLNLNLVKTCYFNDEYNREIIASMVKFNDHISVLIEGKTKYSYELNEDLEIINQEDVEKNTILEIQTLKQRDAVHLYLIEQFNKITIINYNNNEINKILTIPGKYLNYNYINGTFIIYYLYGEKTYKKEISEYHINYINDLILDYYNNDETSINHFNVDSYLEDLDFKLENISPYFNKNICGEYISSYIGKMLNGEYITVNTKMIVNPYINIINDGVYKLGSRLYFFGHATLDGQNITNGYALSKEGKNKIIITDANGKKVEYNIYVVDGYYNSNMDIDLKTTYVVDNGSILYLKINTPKKIKEIYLNENIRGKICLKNNDQYLIIDNNSSYGIDFYNINKIVFEDDSYINIDHNFSVKTKRKKMSYDINEYKENGSLILDINIDDTEQNVKDVYVTINESNKIFYKKNTYCKNISDIINIKKYGQINFDLILSTKEHGEQIIFTYVGEGKKLDYTINYNIEEEQIKLIKFKLDLNDSDLTHSKILIGGVEENKLTIKYQTKKSNIIWYIAIILSSGVIVGFTSYFLVKKYIKKKKGL